MPMNFGRGVRRGKGSKNLYKQNAVIGIARYVLIVFVKINSII